jgi:hypothetical protein
VTKPHWECTCIARRGTEFGRETAEGVAKFCTLVTPLLSSVEIATRHNQDEISALWQGCVLVVAFEASAAGAVEQRRD